MMPDAKRTIVLALTLMFPAAFTPLYAAVPAGAGLAKSEACLTCHEQGSPGLVAHWQGSAHARAQVGCDDCHQAKKGEPDAFEHEGAVIAMVVTPRD